MFHHESHINSCIYCYTIVHCEWIMSCLHPNLNIVRSQRLPCDSSATMDKTVVMQHRQSLSLSLLITRSVSSVLVSLGGEQSITTGQEL